MFRNKQAYRDLAGKRDWLFIALLCLFGAETAWLSVTSRFQMAFDESYHLGLIQFFSHRLNPIVTSQTNSYNLGAIAHNPSFLYHYLLSFPYRLLDSLGASLRVEVVSLRL